MTDPIFPYRPRKAAQPTGRRKCPICGQPATAETQPFCSKRCADADLANWLGGGYRIPGPPAVTDEDPEPQ